MTALAAIGGWRRLQSFSPLLYADVAATPLTIERLTKLAEALRIPPDRVYEASR